MSREGTDPLEEFDAAATAIDESDGSELIGTVIDGRYRLEATLGRGGMGLVYRAAHVGLRRQVAVKILHPSLAASPDVRNRFEREALAVGKIDHPNCVSVYDVGRLPDGSLYLAMELLEGRVARRRARAGRPARARARAAHPRRHAARAVAHPRRRADPPRHQAREHLPDPAGRRRGLRQDPRLRDRQADDGEDRPRRRRQAHAGRHGVRHADLHGARAGARQPDGRPRRPLCRRRDRRTRCCAASRRSTATTSSR